MRINNGHKTFRIQCYLASRNAKNGVKCDVVISKINIYYRASTKYLLFFKWNYFEWTYHLEH